MTLSAARADAALGGWVCCWPEGEAGVTADQNFGMPRSVIWSVLVLEEV